MKKYEIRQKFIELEKKLIWSSPLFMKIYFQPKLSQITDTFGNKFYENKWEFFLSLYNSINSLYIRESIGVLRRL